MPFLVSYNKKGEVQMFKGILSKLNKKAAKVEKQDKEASLEVLEIKDLAEKVLLALGGKENIKNLDACITRLRISVNDLNKVDREQIIDLGAKGVFEKGSNIQAVFGSTSSQIKEKIKDVIEKIPLAEDRKESTEKDGFESSFVSPLSGKLVSLENVPDEVFSKKMLGDGFAIQPIAGEVVSPVNGKIEIFFPTKHAIGIIANNGRKILIHFGIDTVHLKGDGFEALVKQGDAVEIGQPILHIDLDKVKLAAKSIITPIIFTNLSKGEEVKFKVGADVKLGQKEIIKII